MTDNCTTTTSLPSPNKIINYPIADADKGGALFIYGNKSSSKIVLLCPGLPSDHKDFIPLASRLAEEIDCLSGVMCLPGYDDRPDRSWRENKKYGYSFDEMVASMREAAKSLRSYCTNNDANLTFIFHDWGVPIGSMFVNQAVEEENASIIPHNIILFDVAGIQHPDTKDKLSIYPNKKLPFREFAIRWTYRFALAFAFCVYRYVSVYLAPISLLSIFLLRSLNLTPTYREKVLITHHSWVPKTPIRLIYMCYPLFNLCKLCFLGKGNDFFDASSLPKDLKTMPVLYMYGKEKNCMFHDDSTIMYLEREEREKLSKSKVIAVEAGHWLYLEKPDICFDAIKKFMSEI